MLAKVCGLTIWIALTTAVGNSLFVGGVTERTRAMQSQYEQHVNQIRAASASGNLRALEATVADIEKTWAPSDPVSLVQLLRMACDEAHSHVFSDQLQARIAVKKWAETAVTKADKRQMDVQLHLLNSYLRIDDQGASARGSKWTEVRSASAAQWFKAWQDLEESIDPDWILNDPKLAIKPYVPPSNVPFDSGMSPDAMSDPKIREEYKAHLKRNQELTELNKQQQLLRRVQREYAQMFQDYIVSIYSTPPFDIEELKKLSAGLKDEPMRNRILQAVQENEGKHYRR